MQRFDEAIRCFDKIIEINPSKVEAFNNKGIVKVIECFVLLKSKIKRLGVCLMALHRYADAISCSDQILKMYPHNADALNNRGVCLMALERYQEAIECFERALKINPSDVDIFINKGLALMVLEK